MNRVILCVAEKHSVAAEVARVLSRGVCTKRQLSQYFNEYTFSHPEERGGPNQQYVVVHAQGHMLDLQPAPGYEWGKCSPRDLFTCELQFTEEAVFKRNVMRPHAAEANVLMLMLDADREGESIGYDVLDIFCSTLPNDVLVDIRPSRLPKIRRPSAHVLRHVIAGDNNPNKRNPTRTIAVRRARCFGLTYEDITESIYNADPLDMDTVDAVDVRQFIDLRLGYAITRLQTDKLRSSFVDYKAGTFKARKPISFGPCQIPTLGLVHSNNLRALQGHQKSMFALKLVCLAQPLEERGKSILRGIFNSFKSQGPKQQGVSEAPRLVFTPVNKLPFKSYFRCIPTVKAVFDALWSQKNVIVVDSMNSTTCAVKRPLPIATIDMQRALSAHLSSNIVMSIAETLYTRGIISYPRTETRAYPESYNIRYFRDIVHKLRHLSSLSSDEAPAFADLVKYAELLLNDAPGNPYAMQLPRTDSKASDNAHLPIHPLSCPKTPLNKTEELVYLYVVRLFLASISPDAQETQVTITSNLNGCLFKATQKVLTFDGFKKIFRKSSPSSSSSSNPTQTSTTGAGDIVAGSRLLALEAPFTRRFGSQDMNIANPETPNGDVLVTSTLWQGKDHDSIISIDNSTDSSCEVTSLASTFEAKAGTEADQSESNFAPAADVHKLDTEVPALPMKESSLLLAMDKHGIGTDATMAEHITLITKRDYINSKRQVEPLGAELLQFYKQTPMGVQAISCAYRSMLEHGMQLISEGKLDCKSVYNDCIAWGERLYNTIDAVNVVQTKGKGGYTIEKQNKKVARVGIKRRKQHKSPAGNASNVRVAQHVSVGGSRNSGNCSVPPRIRGLLKCCGESCSLKGVKGSCKACGNRFQLPQSGGVVVVLDEECPRCGLSLVTITNHDTRVLRACLRCVSL